MSKNLKNLINNEIADLVGTMSGMFDMSEEQENFYKGELLEFADLIATSKTEV